MSKLPVFIFAVTVCKMVASWMALNGMACSSDFETMTLMCSSPLCSWDNVRGFDLERKFALFSLPGWYVTVKLYGIKRVIHHSIRGDRREVGLNRLTKGLWSVLTTNFMPYKYMRNRFIAKWIPKLSLSIWLYRFSTSVN